MSVKYRDRFSQNAVLQNTVPQNTVLQIVMQRGIKVKSSLEQSLASEARVSQGEETRQLAPKSSSDQVKSCLNAKSLNRNFSAIFRG